MLQCYTLYVSYVTVLLFIFHMLQCYFLCFISYSVTLYMFICYSVTVLQIICFRRNEVCSVPVQVWSRPRPFMRTKSVRTEFSFSFLSIENARVNWTTLSDRCSLTFEDTLDVWNRSSKPFFSGVSAFLGNQGEAEKYSEFPSYCHQCLCYHIICCSKIFPQECDKTLIASMSE